MDDFHQIYDRYAADVHRFSYWLTGDAAVADDVTAETFFRAWTQRRRIRVETVKGYLLTIARNLVRKQLRDAKSHAQIDRKTADSAPGSERAILAREELALAFAVLASVREEDRATFLLRVEHDLPYEEISRMLGVSRTAAKVRVHRVRSKLANALRPTHQESRQ